MNDVIENCQTTFEEDGVNQQTLEDLRSVGPIVALSCDIPWLLHDPRGPSTIYVFVAIQKESLQVSQARCLAWMVSWFI